MVIGSHHFDFSQGVYVMGILNVTPDSFSDGGLYSDPERALDRAFQMEEEGADLIDVGGESTRPGADPVPEDEELKRILPVLKKIVPRLKIPVSLDTRKASIAQAAVQEGVGLINDVSALGNPRMAEVIAQKNIPVILMHMRGEPKTMQKQVSYDDVVGEVIQFLQERIAFAVQKGISRENILIDPGIGFGKRFEDNREILKRLDEFRELEAPLVLGVSRKSFIRQAFGENPPSLLLGNLITAVLAVERGASLLRVHDVRETKQVIHLAKNSLFA